MQPTLSATSLPTSNPRRTHQQRGVTLLVVLVLIMLSMLLVLWASRTSLFDELVASNDIEYQRTFEAAQALLQDAELDIRSTHADGTPCPNTTCRQGVTQLPFEDKDVPVLISTLVDLKNTDRPPCKDGLCAKNTERQDFWNDSTKLAQMMQIGIGARYGQYTGVTASTGNSNPILQKSTKNNRNPNEGGWYWIEILPYMSDADKTGLIAKSASQSSKLLSLNLAPNVLYRITAIAQGTKTNAQGKPLTTVVLQETYARQKPQD